MGKIEYRYLAPEEYESLRPVFEANDGDLPDPQMSAIHAAFDGDEIVGFHVLQYVPHAEPMWIKDTHRGKVNWREFQRGVEKLFDKARGGSYYIFPSDERVAKMCKRGGMVECEFKAWRRDVLPEVIE
jgi:hypothetical protein